MDVNRIICGDALSVLKTLPDNSVDLILTDPPYGINIGKMAKSKSRGQIGFADQCDWDRGIPQKEIFDEMRRVSKNQIIFGGNYFVEFLTNSRCWLVWDKNQIFTGAECELAWTSFDAPVKKFVLSRVKFHSTEKKVHPTQKPTSLMIWCLPFLGSGTTAVAAKELGRNYLGIELSAEYVKIAEKRLSEVQEPLLSTPQVRENKIGAQLF
jgi:site-specific DNA-methyltransferase (adenine-specific)